MFNQAIHSPRKLRLQQFYFLWKVDRTPEQVLGNLSCLLPHRLATNKTKQSWVDLYETMTSESVKVKIRKKWCRIKEKKKKKIGFLSENEICCDCSCQMHLWTKTNRYGWTLCCFCCIVQRKKLRTTMTIAHPTSRPVFHCKFAVICCRFLPFASTCWSNSIHISHTHCINQKIISHKFGIQQNEFN